MAWSVCRRRSLPSGRTEYTLPTPSWSDRNATLVPAGVATGIGAARCPGRSGSSRSWSTHSRPFAPPRYRFQEAGSCGAASVSSTVCSSPIWASATGPHGIRRPGEPSGGSSHAQV
ncbi:hypothetical protein TR51_23905 [Kitasatospora griseola]|uniref:Uncharacterized protein n=1 Tax=Kitasatospora griseola TaxID=2064 RepID=A0A0D0N2B3_KITGR|nr:hypothetical protein TR51_23905 [Kitasatospora griseola]